MNEFIEAERQAATLAGELALLYMRKQLGTSYDIGQLARYGVRAAARYMYWQSEEYRYDGIDALIQEDSGRELGAPRTPEEWNRRAMDFINGVPSSALLTRT
jgi:hypothetical protein